MTFSEEGSSKKSAAQEGALRQPNFLKSPFVMSSSSSSIKGENLRHFPPKIWIFRIVGLTLEKAFRELLSHLAFLTQAHLLPKKRESQKWQNCEFLPLRNCAKNESGFITSLLEFGQKIQRMISGDEMTSRKILLNPSWEFFPRKCREWQSCPR